MAAKRLGTLLSVPYETMDGSLKEFYSVLLPEFPKGAGLKGPMPSDVRVAEVPWAEGWEKVAERITSLDRPPLLSVRVPMTHGTADTVLSLVRADISIIHLEGTVNGRFQDDEQAWLKDGIRSVHQRLVQENVRDGITLLASGGISMAEHVAKSIICGADGVVIDFPILIALECRMCRRCTKGLSCPVDIEDATADWTASRVVNLIGAWHNQLLEMMGAMGIRDARRLRGEAGRAMFFEELERDTFSAMGDIEEGCDIE
jgi:hypothetical protein